MYNIYRDRYHNEKLQEIVKNVYEKKKIIRYKNRLIQQTDPIFLDADNMGFFGFRSHFYAPRKWFCGRYYDTFSFNIMILWLFSLLFYVTLYYDLLKKLVAVQVQLKTRLAELNRLLKQGRDFIEFNLNILARISASETYGAQAQTGSQRTRRMFEANI